MTVEFVGYDKNKRQIIRTIVKLSFKPRAVAIIFTRLEAYHDYYYYPNRTSLFYLIRMRVKAKVSKIIK